MYPRLQKKSYRQMRDLPVCKAISWVKKGGGNTEIEIDLFGYLSASYTLSPFLISLNSRPLRLFTENLSQTTDILSQKAGWQNYCFY
jgi:hypothetical protein